MHELRKFMFEHVYTSQAARGEEKKVRTMLQELYGYFCDHTQELPAEMISLMEKRGECPERVVCDYIAGMTDQYAIRVFKELFVPKAWGIN